MAELGEKRNIDYDFLPHQRWAENYKSYAKLLQPIESTFCGIYCI